MGLQGKKENDKPRAFRVNVAAEGNQGHVGEAGKGYQWKGSEKFTVSRRRESQVRPK